MGSTPETMSSLIHLAAENTGITSFTAQQSVTKEKHDEILTVDALLRHRAHQTPEHVIISYPSSGTEFVDYTYAQLDAFAFRVAKHYEQFLPIRQSSAEERLVVGLLGPSNLEYIVTMLALVKLGHTVLFLSTRISQDAVNSLLETTDAKALITDSRFSVAAQRAQEALPDLQCLSIASRNAFDFPVTYTGDSQLDSSLDPIIEASKVCWIIHSSGSTGLPKPIYQRQSAALANFASNMDMKAFITLPLYHNHGICNFFRAIHSSKSLHLYNADLPLTSENLCKVFREHDFEIFYGVPYALKLLAETEAGIQLLQELKIVMYGGSACPDELGDLLTSHGVNLVSHYGATEVGQLMTSFRPAGDKAWNYVRVGDALNPYLRWIPRGPNLFECCVLEGWPSKVASNQPDGSYCTKDLFEPHPSIPGGWKYIARLDDTLVLVNGEKFNPVLLEGRIRTSPLVQEAVIFGAGRPYLGLLVVPGAGVSDLPGDEIRERLWPLLDSGNKSIEAYGRISKNMIVVLDKGAQYPRTDKGSVIRQLFYKAFAKEINEAYDKDIAASADAKVLSLNESRVYLRQAIKEMLENSVAIEDDTDFFSLGMDSLQAIQLRNAILKHIDIGGHKLGQNVVFDYPSVEKLSNYLLSVRNETSGDKDGGNRKAQVEEVMQALIDKYSELPLSSPPPAMGRTTVVVTGATGSLGAHIVARLAGDASIQIIYCFVRARDDGEAWQRVQESLKQRRLYHQLSLDQRTKIHSLAFQQSKPQLGLSSATYETITSQLSAVIHCAWAVNFNWNLSSFESCIDGVSHLLELCRAANTQDPLYPPASFNFCSSVSTTARAPMQHIPETLPELNWAQGMGYAQSKNVAEHICLRAAQLHNIPARVLRIGQIIADTQHGVWNATEAIPMQLQTALTIGALPRLNENPSWLPVDTVAQAVIDITLSDASTNVFNIANHRSFSWTQHLLPALKEAGLQFDELTPKEWVNRLRDSDQDPKANPPIKLLDFFASKYDKSDDEFLPSKTYANGKACEKSLALTNAHALDTELVKKFVDYFTTTAWAVPSHTTAVNSVTKLDSRY